MSDFFRTIAAPATGEFKDRGSKFLAFAYPVQTEAEALLHLEALRKTHFKANHHCFAWRLGVDGARFRANDDGEPSGTAGRPILGQIDAFKLTDVAVVVVRYFGGTLLGASGLIQAYKESAAAALQSAEIVEKMISVYFRCDFDYALMPDIMNAIKKLQLEIAQENYGDQGCIILGIQKSIAHDRLLHLKALVRKLSVEEAATLDWPVGMTLEPTEWDT